MPQSGVILPSTAKVDLSPEKKTFFQTQFSKCYFFRREHQFQFISLESKTSLQHPILKGWREKTNKSLKIHFLTDSSFSISCLDSHSFISSQKILSHKILLHWLEHSFMIVWSWTVLFWRSFKPIFKAFMKYKKCESSEFFEDLIKTKTFIIR